MWTRGEGMHINPFSHPFHSCKRLRLWRDQGYKATHNPPNTAKKLHKQPQPSCQLKLIHKICSWTSRLLSDKLLKTSEAAPPTQWSRLLLSNRVFIVWKEHSDCLPVCPEEAVSTPGVLPATSSSVSIPLLPGTTRLNWGSQAGETFPANAVPPIPSKHFVSTHISEPNANVLHSPVRL